MESLMLESLGSLMLESLESQSLKDMESQLWKDMSPHERLYHRIKAQFAETVDPSHLMPYLKFLTLADEEEVQAVQNTKGQTNAASELLRKLCRHPDWFDHLLDALRTHNVGLNWLADAFEKHRAEILVVVDINSNGEDDINMSSDGEEEMELDVAPSPQERFYRRQMDRYRYSPHWLHSFKQFIAKFLVDVMQTPDQTLHHLIEISKVYFAGAQSGCLELLLRVDSLSTLHIFEEYYKGGAIKDALVKDLLSPTLKVKLKQAAEEYGIKIKSVHMNVSIKENQFEECARYLRSVEDVTPRRSFREANYYPLSYEKNMHSDELKKRHSWPPVYQDLLHDVKDLTPDTADPTHCIMLKVIKCQEVAELIKRTLEFMTCRFDLNDKLLKDVQKIWFALLCCKENNEHFVVITSIADVRKISVEKRKVEAFAKKHSVLLELNLFFHPIELVNKNILNPASGVKDGYIFSSRLLQDCVEFTLFDSGELHETISYRRYSHIFHAYSLLKKDNSDEWVSLMSKLGSLKQLDLVFLVVSWRRLHDHSLQRFDLLDLCDESVAGSLKHYKESIQRLSSIQVKICSAGIGKSIGTIVNELVKESSKQSIILPADVSDLSLSEFDAILKVLSILDLGPSTRVGKEKENRFESNQCLFLKHIGDQPDPSPSFGVDFSRITLSPEKVGQLCLCLPDMQHVTKYIFNNSKLNKANTMKLLSLLDPVVVKAISLSNCSLDLKSGPLGLSRLSKLVYLDLEQTGIEDAGLGSLEQDLKGLHNLKEINVGCNNISLIGLSQLSLVLVKKSNLVALRIHDNQFGESGGHILGMLVSKLQQLEVLSAWGCDLQDAGMAQLAKFLPVRSQLKRLSLRDNHINGHTSVEVFDRLAQCHYLLFFDYNNNSIFPLEEETEAADSISKAVLKFLTRSKCWDHINFWNCNIGKSSIFDDSLQLKSLHHMTQICLQTNKIDDKMIKKLSETVQHLKYLQHLNLRENQIGDPGAHSLASALSGLKHLKELWLDWNLFGYTGAEKLIEVALSLPSLEDCNLSCCCQLAPPEKHQLLQKFDTVTHDDMFEANLGKLTLLL